MNESIIFDFVIHLFFIYLIIEHLDLVHKLEWFVYKYTDPMIQLKQFST